MHKRKSGVIVRRRQPSKKGGGIRVLLMTRCVIDVNRRVPPFDYCAANNQRGVACM